MSAIRSIFLSDINTNIDLKNALAHEVALKYAVESLKRHEWKDMKRRAYPYCLDP